MQLKEMTMNWDRVEGNWKQVKGSIKEKWGKLTDDNLDVIAGKRDKLAGQIQEKYGISKDEADKQIIWIAKDTNRVLKISANMVALGGAKLTSELTQ